MRPAAFLLLLTCAACVERESYELPALGAHRSMLIAVDAEQEGRLIAAEDDEALLSFWVADTTTHLAALSFDETLAELGIESGTHERTERGRAIPWSRAEETRTAELDGAHLSSWTVSAGALDWLTTFRFPGEERRTEPCANIHRERRVRDDLCFTTPEPFDGFASSIIEHEPTLVCEDDALWMYLVSHRWDPPDRPGDSVHARLAMTALDSLDFGTLAPIFPGPTPNTSSEQPGFGGVGAANVRSDGLEMFFISCRPDGDCGDDEIYVSKRATVHDAWEEPVVLASVTSSVTVKDPVRWAILLPDDRTLFYVDQAAPFGVHAARRKTTTPGDLDFAPASLDASFEPEGTDIGALSISCDGFHLFYYRVEPGTGRVRQRIVEMISFDPLAFGEARDVPILIGDGTGNGSLFGFVELPDCSGAVVSSFTAIYHAEHVACPR